MSGSQKHLLGIEDLERGEIETLLEAARRFQPICRHPGERLSTLEGRSIVHLFLEPSTRTRLSFEMAAKRLGALTLDFSPASSSVAKGESLSDTVRTLEAMNPDLVVLRHPSAGAAHFLACHTKRAAVVNAGDGMHEHPTQALLDALTILDHRTRLEGLKVAIVGDIAHSRVARSDAILLGRLGARVALCAPPTLLPQGFKQYGAELTWSMEEALSQADVVMMLRLQRERQRGAFFPSRREYFSLFGLTREKMKWARPDALILHPGPINRGVEIESGAADGKSSCILQQVTNGVAVRMAVLEWLLSDGEAA